MYQQQQQQQLTNKNSCKVFTDQPTTQKQFLIFRVKKTTTKQTEAVIP